MNSREQRIADFRAGAKWYAQRAAECAPDTSTEMGRLADQIERASGVRDVPMGPTDAEIAQALGPDFSALRDEMLEAVHRRDARADALAEVDVMMNDADIPGHVRGQLREALRRMPGWGKNPARKTTESVAEFVNSGGALRTKSVSRNELRIDCERVFLYRLAEWLRGDLLNAPIPLANAITDLLACGEPGKRIFADINYRNAAPPAKEEPK